MRHNDTENEVYFLGDGRTDGRRARKKRIAWIAISVLSVAVLSCALFMPKRTAVTDGRGNVLGTVTVLPAGGSMPVFDGDGDINDFMRWVMLHIRYPEGLENKPARVVVSFVVQTDGTLGRFKVIESPENKAYAESVIELLKHSPQWKPARLSDGRAVGMEFTLPVIFCQTIKQ